jgi:Mg2+-importing ATPase
LEFNKNLSLSTEDLEECKTKFGPNSVKQKRYNFTLGFLKNLFSPFNIILFAITGYNIYNLASSDDSSDLVPSIIQISVVVVMIVISVLIGYIQEIKTFYYIKDNKSYNDMNVAVIRNFEITEINNSNYLNLLNEKVKVKRSEIFPGDLVYLRSGDLVPADLQILFAKGATVDQSSVTGESYPVEKCATFSDAPDIERTDVCFQNTVISSGFIFGRVLKTGKDVVFNKINSEKRKSGKDAFRKSLWRISVLLIAYTLVFSPIILAIKGIETNDWEEALVFAVAIAIGITPEMLPVIVSTNLMNGIKKVSNKKIVIKNLSTLQNFGAMDVLCLDKTGTLTNGFINLGEVITYGGLDKNVVSRELYFASKLQAGFNNAIDKAIKDKFKIKYHNDSIEKLNELPFDFQRKRSTLIFKDGNNKKLFTKGAPDKILDVCTRIYKDGKVVPMDENDFKKIKTRFDDYNKKGYRIVAFAEKETIDEKISMYDESEMIFLGFATFNDELKPESKDLFRTLKNQNVDFKILTGDNEVITKQICEATKVEIKGIINGETLGNMSDQEFLEAVMKNNVFVKLDPTQKQKIIWALKENNLTVGFAGDGANDILSFKEADVAISFDDVDPNIRSHADAIIVNDQWSVVDKAVQEGRISFANILKYMKITISSNIGNMISVLVASLWLPFLPMLGIQILVQNLIYDISQFSLINDNVDKSFLENPQKLSIRRVLLFSIINAPVSSIFDITTYLILFYGFGYQTVNDQPAFNSGWFIVGLLTQTLVMLNYRTERTNIFGLKIKKPQYISIVIVTIIAFVIPYTVIGSYILLDSLSLIFIPIALGIIFAYLVLASTVKYLYIKKFKSWL